MVFLAPKTHCGHGKLPRKMTGAATDMGSKVVLAWYYPTWQEAKPIL
jgi:hypothetical protein